MKITYILVTYNRLELLKKTLAATFNMSRKFDVIIIVNNCSTDGTKEFLDNLGQDYPELTIVHADKNLGGSGGFNLGIQVALNKTPDSWLFLADDDAIPDKDMLKNLVEGYNNLDHKDEISVLCTSVINCGEIDLEHRRRVKVTKNKVMSYGVNENEYSQPFYLDEATFVGFTIQAKLVKKIGLPIKEFFIFYDDTEYSLRAAKYGKLICIPTAKMYHDTKLRNMSAVNWKDYYKVRNCLYVIQKYYDKKYLIRKYKDLKFRKISLIAKILKHRTKDEIEMFKAAIKDGMQGTLGVHPLYNPTWHPGVKKH